MSEHKKQVCLGKIRAVHGVKGLVKITSWTENPADITAYGPLYDSKGKTVALSLCFACRGGFVAKIEGVHTREAAAQLVGTQLFVPRSVLDQPSAEEYYITDLLGMALIDQQNRPVGRVRAIQNFGAGDLIVVHTADRQEKILPFTKAIFPEIDMEQGKIYVVPPEELWALSEKTAPDSVIQPALPESEEE